jgi:DNA-binding response OmpR family regulator
VANQKAFIVEDEAITAMYLKAYLKKKGYEVMDPAVTGEEAIARSLDEKPDMILMDIMLGGPLDGIEAARAILERQDVPIVFMTGFPTEEIMARVTELPHIGFVSKPFTILSLDAVIPLGA